MIWFIFLRMGQAENTFCDNPTFTPTPVFKVGLILESIFNFVSLEKIFVKSLFIFFSAYSGKFRDSYFEHLFEDETKLTIPSMIMPPLPKLIELNGHK